MRERVSVHLGQVATKVGTLLFQADNGRQHSVFTYDDAWIANAKAFPISPTMPFERRTFYHSKASIPHASAFEGPIADTCPDAWGQAIINRDRRSNSRSICDWDYLTGVDDALRLGALRFRDEDGTFIRQAGAGRPIVPPLLDLPDLMRAADAVEGRTETAHDLRRLLGNGSSLGGARPKCSVMDADGSLLIAKFTSRQDTLPVERMEVATLALARKVGLRAPDARIIDVAGRPVALMRRFDRGSGGRVPYVSAQTVLGLDGGTGSSYEAMGEEMRRHCSQPKAELNELFRRIAFTILVSNVDDHLRNHGFVYSGQRQWGLSPLFDVNPSPERDRRLKTTIGDGSGDDASVSLLIDHSHLFDFERATAARSIADMAAAIEVEWRGCARLCGMSSSEIASYEPAFVHDESDAAKALSLKRDAAMVAPPGVARSTRKAAKAKNGPGRAD